MPVPIKPANCVRHVIDITIDAPPARVWRALTEEINNWWLPEFRMAKNSQRLRLEPKIGGRWCEEAPGGAGILWGTIIGVTKGSSIQAIGHVAPPWGADTWICSMDIEETDTGTAFRFSEVVMGDLTQEQADEIEHGWNWLFTDGLKAYCEAQKGAKKQTNTPKKSSARGSKKPSQRR